MRDGGETNKGRGDGEGDWMMCVRKGKGGREYERKTPLIPHTDLKRGPTSTS